MWLRILGRFRAFEMALACFVLALLVGVVVLGSAARYMGTPIIASIEIAQALFVWLCVLAADLTLQRNGHFSVDVVTSLLPETLQRGLQLLTLLVVFALLAYLCWQGTSFALIVHDRPMPLTGVPSSYIVGALPVGFALMLVTLAERVHAILTGGAKLRSAPPREVM